MLSVLCPTAHPGPLVAAALSALRDVAGEIVIAADARVGGDDLAYYADVADVLVRYEHAGANRHWPWLASLATGDWVLILDGDELPSAALADALPELVADRRVRQYSLPIHWTWPDAASRLATEPWDSDRRLRLLRNDAGLTFAARKHALADADPPIRFLDELPVYHLDLLLGDRARREAKAARYDAERYGLLTPEGEPFNRAFYVPEAAGSPATLPIPAVDAERIAAALGAARDAGRTLDPAALPLYDRAAVEWHAPRTELPADAYRGAVTLARPLPRFTAQRRDQLVWVEVTNAGSARWPYRHDPVIRLGAAWQPVMGGPRQEVGRTPLPHALGPGETTLVGVEVCAPPLQGPAELVIDLVHEGGRWFDCGLHERVEVGPSVDERIAALAHEHGLLLPYPAVMGVRRAVGARDALIRQEPPGTAPADPRLAELTAGLAVGVWALDASAIDRIAELVRAQRPATAVEFGSGTSTVVLAALLAEIHGDDRPRLLSFEQDPAWAQRTRQALAERGLAAQATVIELALGDPGGDAPAGFVLTDAAAAALRETAPELILVDGPTLDSGASRLGTIDLVAPYLKADATLLLDDALRDAELCIAAAWAEREDVDVHGIRPTAKGLLEATLKAPVPPRRPLAARLLRRGA